MVKSVHLFQKSCKKVKILVKVILHEKCPCSKFFWSVFSRIWTEYGDILRIHPYSVHMREKTEQKNSEYGHFSRRVNLKSKNLVLNFVANLKWVKVFKNGPSKNLWKTAFFFKFEVI